MDKKSIIQWNCRGLKANYNEILILTTLLSPTVFCLQETFLKNTDNINFKNYSLYNHIANENQKASGGSSILVKSNVPHRQIDINSNFPNQNCKLILQACCKHVHTSFAGLRKAAFGTFWQACPCLRHACGTLAACLSMQACTSMHLEPFGKLVHACACLRFCLTWLCLEKGMLAQACTCLLQACPSAT